MRVKRAFLITAATADSKAASQTTVPNCTQALPALSVNTKLAAVLCVSGIGARIAGRPQRLLRRLPAVDKAPRRAPHGSAVSNTPSCSQLLLWTRGPQCPALWPFARPLPCPAPALPTLLARGTSRLQWAPCEALPWALGPCWVLPRSETLWVLPWRAGSGFLPCRTCWAEAAGYVEARTLLSANTFQWRFQVTACCMLRAHCPCHEAASLSCKKANSLSAKLA